uniref:TAP-C domain-containing protein n=1 Tax=Hymenolepis diminuta TaxID=6216 RepID=A0A0R3SFT8_HYMDI
LGSYTNLARRKLDEDFDVDMKLAKSCQDNPKKPLHKRLKNKERKKRLRKFKVDFVDKILALEHVEPIPEPILELPTLQSSFTPSPDIAILVSAFLMRKMDLLEQREGIVYLPDFYFMNCSLSVHAAPFIAEKYDTIMGKNSANRKDCKGTAAVDSMLPYVLASSNLLKGNWPLPSWALEFDNTEPRQKLDKFQRKKLQVVRKIQDFNSKYFKRQQKRIDLSGISQFETSHAAVHAAPTGICFQYRTLCLEMPREQSKNKTSILLHAPLVRWVQRTVILLPPPVLKIINEIICVIPVSEEQQAKHADVIRNAIEIWVSSIEKTGFIATGLPQSEVCEKVAKISQFSSVTGMNQAYSEQCLSECDWNVQIAMEAFRRVQEAGMLPESAFT